jgi:uncharacterized protein
MRLASIHTYPVKGCHRIDSSEAVVEPWGLAGDRRWVVIEPDGTPLTQRECPVMTRVRPSYEPGSALLLRAPGMADLDVPEPAEGEPLATPVWRAPVPARAAGPAADGWLTEVLGRKARLLWLDDPTRRRVNPEFGRPDDRVSFADGYPLLLANTASLDALNGWLLESGSGPLPMTRFRPNVVVAGAGAWDEDHWVSRRVRIGPVAFRVVKPCGRCVVTTTDQETGERGSEPLRVLARHRAFDQKLLFGVYLVPDRPLGRICVGQPVAVLDRAA